MTSTILFTIFSTTHVSTQTITLRNVGKERGFPLWGMSFFYISLLVATLFQCKFVKRGKNIPSSRWIISDALVLHSARGSLTSTSKKKKKVINWKVIRSFTQLTCVVVVGNTWRRGMPTRRRHRYINNVPLPNPSIALLRKRENTLRNNKKLHNEVSWPLQTSERMSNLHTDQRMVQPLTRHKLSPASSSRRTHPVTHTHTITRVHYYYYYSKSFVFFEEEQERSLDVGKPIYLSYIWI